MADCCITPVGNLKEIGKIIFIQCLLPPIKSHIDYWWCFDNNIEVLKYEVQDLERKIFDINQRIEEARLRTDNLRSEVEKWSKAGFKKLEEARRILTDDINPKAWNLISRYSMGKRTKKAAEEIAKHQKDWNFNAMADPVPPPAMGFMPDRSAMDFESRKCIEEHIIESLKDSSVGMIGICGMGGVGKTTMARRIRERVMEEKLFDEVVMVVVSQEVNMLKIQMVIAECLGLKFDVESMHARADKLHMRLTDTKRKIIIFDDVWEKLILEDLGFTFENQLEMCKILLTTRSKDVCTAMEVQKIFTMDILTEDEAWTLFREKAGDCGKDSVLFSVAKDIVAECRGLPIALVTVGTTLLNREKSIWFDTRSQLRGSIPRNFPEVLVDVYKVLKLSYDYLDSDSERDLLLLCCLFPEDYDISIELLTLYSMGLRLFDGNSSIEQARRRMQILVDKLKSRFLLIDGRKELHVKIYDVVRDVFIYVGSAERNGFLKSLNQTSIESSSDAECNWMSVDISNERMEAPMAPCFPNLRLLMLMKSSSNECSNISFQGMKNLNVLSFLSTWIGSLPATLGLLNDLRALCLFESEVENISVIGQLSSLEIFICNGCKNITELPAEIGRLNRLRLMELNGCSNLQRIPFGILSSLVRLEELKMIRSFDGWEAEENGKEMRNASLTELESLYSLTCLEIEISDSNLAAQEIRLSPKLVNYRIHIGFKDDWHEETNYEKVMKLNLPSDIGAVGKWIQILVKNTEWLYLQGDGSNNINLEECQHLRNLDFRNCSRVKKLVKTKDSKSGILFPMLETMRLEELGNLEEICDGTIILNQSVSFRNLKSIVITKCSNLRYLFSGSVATTCLLGLEVLEILRCEAMEQVFRNDTYGCIELPKLKQLRLGNLPILKAFCLGLENIKFPNLTEMWIGEETPHDDRAPLHFLCNPKELKIRGSFSELETGGERRNAAVRELESLPNLTCLEIEIPDWNLAPQDIRLSPKLVKYCIRVTADNYLIEPRDYDKVIILNFLNDIVAVGKWIQILVKNTESLILEGDGSNNFNIAECDNLKDLKFSNCSRVKKLMKTKDCKLGIVFPLLETLSLWGLKNLEEIWDGTIILNQSVSFRNIKSIVITECSNLRYLFSVSVVTTCLLQLEVLEILRCEGMERVFRNEITDNDTNVPIEFPKLKKLELFNLPNLTTFCQGVQNIKFPQLTEMVIGNLPKLDTICSFNLRTLFSLSMARENPFQLEVLDIQWCEAMEQVLMNEIKDVPIEFPKLKKLKLSKLPMSPNHQET